MRHELEEYQTKSFAVGPPSPADLRVAEQLNSDFHRKLELRWLHDGALQVRSFSWVGVVVLSAATIQVRPKLAGSELNLVRMIEYTAGLENLRTSQLEREIDPSGDGLLDLLCVLLAEQAEVLVGDGLIHDYTSEEQALPALRGTLRFREQATRRFGQLDVLECRYDEFHADVFDNRFLAAGVAAGARICQSKLIRNRLRRLEQNLTSLTSTGPHDSGYYLARRTYTRQNERYRSAHELCLILIDRIGVDDVYGSAATRSFSFMLNMNDIFEAFISKMVREAFDKERWRVTTSQRYKSVIRRIDNNKTYSAIIPDILLERSQDVVPFDCKYKLYENKKLSTADIYQTFLYAYALGSAANPRAGIIYPSSTPGLEPKLGVARLNEPTMAELTGIGVDLVQVLESRSDRDSWTRSLTELRLAMSNVLESARSV